MRSAYFLIFAFFLAGCVTTKTAGFVDPEYKKRAYQVSKVVVRVVGASLEETQIAEQKFAEKFNAHNVEVIKFTDIVPPTRSYSVEQVAGLLVKSGADSTFTVFVTGRDVSKTYVPPTYHPGKTTSTINTVGNVTHVSTQSAPGYTTGGYSVSRPLIGTFSSLMDNKSGHEIWRAEGRSSGTGFSSYSDLIVGAGIDAIKDMYEKGLLSGDAS